MNKLRSNKGESITETLVALMIIALVFVFLAAAIVTAAKVNEVFRQKDVTFSLEGTPVYKGDVTVRIDYTSDGGPAAVSLTAKRYHVDSGDREEGYDYYEYQISDPTP